MTTKPKKPVFHLVRRMSRWIPSREAARKEFLSEPEVKRKEVVAPKPEQEKEKKPFPWEAPGVNPRIIIQQQLRFPEPDYLLLKYVFENSKYKSLHAFMIQAIMKEAKKELKGILESEKSS